MWNFWKRAEPKKPRFKAVRQLIEGNLKPQFSHDSLLFFTVHKAASSFVGRLLRVAADANRIHAIDYDGYLHSVQEEAGDRAARDVLNSALLGRPGHEDAASEHDPNGGNSETLRRLFPAKGFYFGPLRHPMLLTRLPHLEEFRSLILLRDPRDCLTSMYFSVAFSHNAPGNPDEKERFEKNRNRVRELAIDDFVLAEAPVWLNRYKQYCDALQRHPNLHLVKYEQLVTDFPGWLERVSTAWGIEFSAQVRRALERRADFDVAEEDVYSHKRQVQPGDHARKLKPETITKLTEKLRPVLEALDYPLTVDSRQAA